MAILTRIPSFDERLAEIAAAEQAEGWLVACEDSERYLVPCRELVAVLAQVLERLAAGGGQRGRESFSVSSIDSPKGVAVRPTRKKTPDPFPRPVLEVCAGNGKLAEALATENVKVIATDYEPSGGGVQRATAEQALRRYSPAVVIGSFVPVDSGVDEAVMAFPSVQHYMVLGARLGGEFGSRALRQACGWRTEPLENVTRWMITRHDVWLGLAERPILRHGEAWLLSRN